MAWIALHARTVEQHYAGEAHWDAIGELKQAVAAIPVLGNGDIWEAADAVAMMRDDRLRRRRDRPRLPRPSVAVRRPGRSAVGRRRPAGTAARPSSSRRCARHARLLAEHYTSSTSDGNEAVSIWPCATSASTPSWYLTGYPVGSEVRRRLAQVVDPLELDDLLGGLDPATELVAGGERIKRGHTNGPIKVALPAGYLDDSTTRRPDDPRRRRRDGALGGLTTCRCVLAQRIAAPAWSCSPCSGCRSRSTRPTSTRAVRPGETADRLRRRLALDKAMAVVDRLGVRRCHRARRRHHRRCRRRDPRQTDRRRRRPADAAAAVGA